MKIQIKNCFDFSVIFECEADSMKLAVELAIKSGANPSGADLYGASLSRADLSGANLSGSYLYGACPPIVGVSSLQLWRCESVLKR